MVLAAALAAAFKLIISLFERRGGGGSIFGTEIGALAVAGSGGESMLLPPAKAVRLLGVASRIMIFMLCLAGVSLMRSSGVSVNALV